MIFLAVKLNLSVLILTKAEGTEHMGVPCQLNEVAWSERK